MNVRLTLHAEEQIQVRGLDRDKVIAVALAPEQIVRTEGKPLIAQSRFWRTDRQYLMRIAFRDEVETRVVLTVYITSQVRKYWQEV